MALNVKSKVICRKNDKIIDTSVPRTIRFDDFESSDIDDGDFVAESSAKKCSPRRFHKRILWDSGLGSPSLESPMLESCDVVNDFQSPIPLKIDDDDENECLEDGSKMPPTPPHNRLRTLRLQDTPQTPKSLVQRAQRMNLRSRNLPKNQEGKFSDPHKLQANVNPFTDETNNVVYSSGIKRGRNDVSR